MKTAWPARVFVAVAVASAAVASVAELAASQRLDGRAIERFGFVAVIAAYLLVGLVLIERRRGNPVGPIVFAIGGLSWVYVLADAYILRPEGLPDAAVAAWAIGLLDAPLFVMISLVFLLFPEGRLPSSRWRWLVGTDLVLLPIVITGSALAPGRLVFYPQFENPFAAPGFPGLGPPAYLALLVSVGLSALSLAGRWRGAGRVERAQLKWVASSAVVIATAMGSYGLVIGPGAYNPLFDAAVSFGLGFFPVAVGVAILRYRLFEIDRLVSRTITYLVISATLAASFASVVLLLQGPLGAITGGETIPVAASTLVVAALFQPLRRSVQLLVDRRFDRARFDAERTSVAFAARLHRDLDIDSVTADLRGTVAGALRPSGQWLWIRESSRR